MKKNKIRVGVIFGGKSFEHEISLLSAKNIIEALDQEKYEVVLIGIDRQGQWHLSESSGFLAHADDPKRIQLDQAKDQVVLVPKATERQLVSLSGKTETKAIDVAFPVLHGPFGEDGTVQGLLKLADIPFVGASVLGSAVGMDKDVMKRLLRDAKIPVAGFLTLYKQDVKIWSFEAVVKELGLPFFVKPANAGSSVGVKKVKEKQDYEAALFQAFEYDNKILLEEYIPGREIECSLLGNEYPIVSLPGEIIPNHEFYSYEAKYIDEKGACLKVPVDLEPEILSDIQTIALKAFKVLCCEGMARADFFLKESGEVLLNEINTIPGFTKISMYPKLWEASGLSYAELIDRLIGLAIERFEREKQLKTSFYPSEK